jgi:hypothetical protein
MKLILKFSISAKDFKKDQRLISGSPQVKCGRFRRIEQLVQK